MKVYILEDEPNILKYLISLVEKIPFVQLVGYASEIASAQKEIPELSPELILSDIQLSDGNSFSLFSSINTHSLQIIFITAYDQFAIEALNLGAFAYLLKPIDPIVLNNTLLRCYQKQEQFKVAMYQLQIAQQHYQGEKEIKRISLRTSEGIDIISIEEIIYCQSDKGYTTFFLKGGEKILISKVLKTYDKLLPAHIFVRCHQSYLVNSHYIKKYYKEGILELTTGEHIPVAERRREYVQTFLLKE
nr:LytTR family DNA-binding domain-containing protein [uncultured Capnocytophaga sp.]